MWKHDAIFQKTTKKLHRSNWNEIPASKPNNKILLSNLVSNFICWNVNIVHLCRLDLNGGSNFNLESGGSWLYLAVISEGVGKKIWAPSCLQGVERRLGATCEGLKRSGKELLRGWVGCGMRLEYDGKK